MTARRLELILPADAVAKAEPLLEKIPANQRWSSPLNDDLVRMTVLLRAEDTEVLVDRLTQAFGGTPGFRVFWQAVEATIPSLDPDDDEPKQVSEQTSGRISRQELYEDIATAAKLSPVYLINVVLSSVVATIGLIRDDIAVIIGAMVIAPLLGPNVALALAATLGDLKLARRTIQTGMAGVATAVVLAVAIGWVADIDPRTPAMLARTNIGFGDIALALAAGTAGTLAFTSGVPAALIGVMVAVALLPPLVTSALFVGAGYIQPALGAALLYLINVACVNLSGIATFLAYGIHPQFWWEEGTAKKSTRVAVASWFGLLVLIGAIWWWAGPQIEF